MELDCLAGVRRGLLRLIDCYLTEKSREDMSGEPFDLWKGNKWSPLGLSIRTTTISIVCK